MKGKEGDVHSSVKRTQDGVDSAKRCEQSHLTRVSLHNWLVLVGGEVGTAREKVEWIHQTELQQVFNDDWRMKVNG